MQSNEEIVFNFYTFCKILKGCLVEFCNISKEKANLAIENSNLFKSPIQNVNDVYFFLMSTLIIGRWFVFTENHIGKKLRFVNSSEFL